MNMCQHFQTRIVCAESIIWTSSLWIKWHVYILCNKYTHYIFTYVYWRWFNVLQDNRKMPHIVIKMMQWMVKPQSIWFMTVFFFQNHKYWHIKPKGCMCNVCLHIGRQGHELIMIMNLKCNLSIFWLSVCVVSNNQVTSTCHDNFYHLTIILKP